MNERTADMLIKFVKAIPRAVCRCSVKEALSDNHIDCMQSELQEMADQLVDALHTDETLLRL